VVHTVHLVRPMALEIAILLNVMMDTFMSVPVSLAQVSEDIRIKLVNVCFIIIYHNLRHYLCLIISI
jgi:hypothetical protein